MSFQEKADESRLLRGLVTLFLMVVTVGLAVNAVRTMNPFLIGAVFILPVAAFVISRPTALLIGLYLASYSKLVLPGLPGGITLVNLLQMMLVGWAILHTALSKERNPPIDLPGKFLLFFMINIGLIIAVRGFGMGSLGGDQYGGKAYILISISILFYLVAPKFSLTEKSIRILFWGAVICSSIPFIAQALLYLSGGRLVGLARFFDLSHRMVNEAMSMGGEMESIRWSQSVSLAQVLLMIGLVLPWIRSRKIIAWSIIGAAVFLVMISGFRSSVFGMGVMIFWWIIYNSKKRMATFGLFALLGVVGWLVALAVVSYLPMPAQRALSFLPLMEARVDPEMLLEAQQSVDFRFEIWEYAWHALPQYLLVGRGLLLDVTGWAWLQAGWYGQPEFFYAGHAYHSGPLSLLVDFGLPGFICGTGFMISTCLYAWRGARRYCGQRKDLLSAFYLFMTIKLSYQCVGFFLVYGMVRQSLPDLILLAVLIKVLQTELMRREAENVDMLPDLSVD